MTIATTCGCGDATMTKTIASTGGDDKDNSWHLWLWRNYEDEDNIQAPVSVNVLR